MSLSLQWGDVPTWFSAVSTTGAFIAAGFAASWTARTAKSADAQVKVVREQAAAEREQLDLAKNEAERQRALAESAEERAREADKRAVEAAERERVLAEAAEVRFLRTQIDMRAPTVYVRATPGSSASDTGGLYGAPFLSAVPSEKMHEISTGKIELGAYHVSRQMTLTEDDDMLFIATVTLELVNCSSFPARIDFVSYPNLELLGLRQGQELVIPPDETRKIVARRRLAKWQLRTEEDINDSEVSFLQIEYWVRDLGMNLRDTYRFNQDVRFFKRDGSRLIVEPEPPYVWHEVFGAQVGDRLYERLDLRNASGSE
ncbi:hypothetical protein ABJI51_17335 [Amycolatopsis sp. NEAU-NG30]|uniref:Uncharacterized protein n=1 Tax=Amycolatopsis melonis TaxID=3156488 RepID=A0ABV0LEX6_9PSEU